MSTHKYKSLCGLLSRKIDMRRVVPSLVRAAAVSVAIGIYQYNRDTYFHGDVQHRRIPASPKLADHVSRLSRELGMTDTVRVFVDQSIPTSREWTLDGCMSREDGPYITVTRACDHPLEYILLRQLAQIKYARDSPILDATWTATQVFGAAAFILFDVRIFYVAYLIGMSHIIIGEYYRDRLRTHAGTIAARKCNTTDLYAARVALTDATPTHISVSGGAVIDLYPNNDICAINNELRDRFDVSTEE